MQIGDFHVHSTGSDGELTPNELVELAIKLKLPYICFTDHYPFPPGFKEDSRWDHFHSEKYFQEAQTAKEKYKDKIKIVAMHHHLIAIPDTGSDQLTVVDAGDVLRTVLDTKVDVVLCGHKHRPWAWNFKTLTVVNAGTATSERVRGFFENTYNILTIDQGKVQVDLKIVGGKRVSIDDMVNNYSQFHDE